MERRYSRSQLMMVITFMIVCVQSQAFTAIFVGMRHAAMQLTETDAKSTLESDDDDTGKQARSSTHVDSWRRRLVLTSSLSSLVVLNGSQKVDASDVRAPPELLRPPTRVRRYIDEAVILCQTITEDSSGLERLQQFLDRDSFIKPDEEKAARLYLEIDTTTPWQQARLKDREARGKENGIDYTTPYDKMNTAIQQWGERRQFEILSKRQRALEEANPVRAALNAYTNNLVFSDSYQLNALIRNNALPDVNAVVVSDLDLRDLFRNQVLEKLDDANAEIEYQLKTKDIDTKEISRILKEAQVACNEWFSFIPFSDVEEAQKAVEKES
eukprot:scaffold609_cov170-Amphora_coffeaeformis.AAC.54